MNWDRNYWQPEVNWGTRDKLPEYHSSYSNIRHTWGEYPNSGPYAGKNY